MCEYCPKLALAWLDGPHFAYGYAPPSVETYGPWADPEITTPEALLNNFKIWVTRYYNHPNPESFEGIFYGKGGEGPVPLPPLQVQMIKQTNSALFDEKVTSTILPNVKVSVIVCTKSIWSPPYALLETARLYREHIAEGRKIRPLSFSYVEGANHVVSYNIP
jgi:hypothetical protein